MSKVYFSCFRDVAKAHGSAIQSPADYIGTVELSVGSSSSRIQLPEGTNHCEIEAKADAFVLFGNELVTATSGARPISEGVTKFYSPKETHVAVIQQ